MVFYGLVEALRTYCTDNHIYLIYGNDQYVNALADSKLYHENELILLADFTIVPTITSGTTVGCRYSGVMSLGMKTEFNSLVKTTSSIDETPMQKYDRRLKYLTTQLTNIIGEIACDNELDIINANIKFDLNKFDLSADFVAANVTFEQ